MTRRSASDLATDALLLGVAAVWGASFLSAQGLAQEVGVVPAASLRFLVAAAALGAICVARRVPLPRGRGLLIAVALGCSQAAVIGLETWGVTLTSATNAGLLISLSLVMTPLLEGIAERSWLPRGYFAAAVGAVAGVALLVSGGGLRPPTPGDLLVIAAATVRAFHVTASGRLTRGRSESTLGVVMVQMLVCAAGFTAGAAPALPGAVSRLDASGWFDVLFLGLLCSVFAFVAQLWAVRRTSASRASILMGTEPVWALLVGVVIAGEIIGPAGVCGAAVIVAASYAGQAIERRHRLRIGRVGVDSEKPPTERGLPGDEVVGNSRISPIPTLYRDRDERFLRVSHVILSLFPRVPPRGLLLLEVESNEISFSVPPSRSRRPQSCRGRRLRACSSSTPTRTLYSDIIRWQAHVRRNSSRL